MTSHRTGCGCSTAIRSSRHSVGDTGIGARAQFFEPALPPTWADNSAHLCEVDAPIGGRRERHSWSLMRLACARVVATLGPTATVTTGTWSGSGVQPERGSRSRHVLRTVTARHSSLCTSRQAALSLDTPSAMPRLRADQRPPSSCRHGPSYSFPGITDGRRLCATAVHIAHAYATPLSSSRLPRRSPLADL